MAWGAIAAAVAPSIISGLMGNKQKTVQQTPMLTQQQSEAQKALLNFAKTGNYGKFTAGEEIPLGYGDFNMTGLERQGQEMLSNRLSAELPDQFNLGDMALEDLLATSPQQIEAQFNPFKDQTARAMREAETALKRNAGFAGNLYSTDTIRGLGDIQARGNETMMSRLAELTNQALDRRLQAIPLAYQSGNMQESIERQRMADSQMYGGLQRQLNDQSIKARDQEILRRRQELGMPIQALQNLSGASAQFGVPSVSVNQPSPYQDVLNALSNVGGQYLNQEIYKMSFPDAPYMRY